MYSCRFCGYKSENIEDFEEDTKNHKGYWCPYCDGFTYFPQAEVNHNFRLIFEKKDMPVIKSEKVPFQTQVSPLRWPGGKSKFVGQVLKRCNPENMVHFVEPFAGGVSVGLSLLLAGKVKELYLNDLDYGVYSLFQVIKTCPWVLIEKIRRFVPTKEAYCKAQRVVRNGYENMDMVDAAWNLLVTNRLAFSGIPMANCMGNPGARWNSATLEKRIHKIHEYAEHIHVSCMDAVEFTEKMYWYPQTTIFLDPPYKEKGQVLYMESYEKNDHESLALLLDELYKGMPGADMLLTYDDNEYIRDLYRFPIVEEVGRKYCIAN